MKEFVTSWENLVEFAKVNYGLKELSKLSGLASSEDFEVVDATPYCCTKSRVLWTVSWGEEGQPNDGADVFWWDKDHIETSYIRLAQTTYFDLIEIFQRCGWKATRFPLLLPSERML